MLIYSVYFDLQDLEPVQTKKKKKEERKEGRQGGRKEGRKRPKRDKNGTKMKVPMASEHVECRYPSKKKKGIIQT